MATVTDTIGIPPEDMSQNGQGEPPKAPVEPSNQPPAQVPPKEEPPAQEADKPKEEPPKEEAKEEQAKPEDGEWLTTGDEVADTAIDLMKDAGVSVKDAEGIFGKAMQSGKIEDIDIATLEAKVGKAKANLVLAGIRDWHTRVGAKNLATVAEVHTVVGGEAAWATLRDWAGKQEAANPDFAKDLAEYRGMLDAGGKAAKFAAQELVNLYNADPNTKGLNNSIVKGDGKPAPVGGPLGRAEYYALVSAAEAKGDRQAVASLNARRRAGKAAGL